MFNPPRAPHLKLVKPDSGLPNHYGVPEQNAVQSDLFPMAKSWLLIFTDTTELSADRFVSLLNDVQPTYILDVRPTPRFDMGRLNRRTAFKIFRENHIKYLDVAGLTGVSSRRDANLNPSLLVDSINNMLQNDGAPLTGPLVFLFDDKDLLCLAMDVFPKSLRQEGKRHWDFCLI